MFNLLKSKARIRQEKYVRAGITPDNLILIWRGCLPADMATHVLSAGKRWKTEDWVQVGNQYYQKVQETIHFNHDDKYEFELRLQKWLRVYDEVVLPRGYWLTVDEIKVLWEYIAVAILCGHQAADATNDGRGMMVIRRLRLVARLKGFGDSVETVG